MRYERWFEIDGKYTPEWSLFAEIRKFFAERKGSVGNKGMPSYNDMTLILYSKDTVLPLISNDRHICNLREDLERKRYTHKIIPLMDCILENLN